MSRVAVVGGGQSSEHDVSLASAAAVTGALSTMGHATIGLTIDPHGVWRDREGRPIGLAGAVQVLRTCDAVVPMLHGRRGEDGTLAGLCELAGVPYVGSPVIASAIAMDKWAAKLVAAGLGIAVAPGRVLTRATAPAYRFGKPVVVKPVTAGSSRGVTLAESAQDLDRALTAAFALDDRVLVEDVVHGREIDVAVMGRPDGTRDVAPLLEIMDAGIFDYATKYGGSARFAIPAPVSAADRSGLEAAAVAVFDALGCRGVARVDFFLTPEGVVFNEANTIPGFTESSQVPKMFAAAGLSYPELVDRLVRDALG